MSRSVLESKPSGAVRAAILVVGLVVPAVSSALAGDAADGWPRRIEAGGYVVTLYQPQIESLEGDRLESRAAVSVRPNDGSGEPAFGAVWMSARLEVDRASRMMTVRELEVPEVRFPEATDEERVALARLLETTIPDWELTFALDRVVPDLDDGAEFAETVGLSHAPPVIVQSREPAVLVAFDGEPVVRGLEGAPGIESVVNTPFPVLREQGAKTFYLHGGGTLWYTADDPLGPWAVADGPVPAAIERLVESQAPADGDEGPGDVAPPAIVTATEPTELVVTDGDLRWAPIDGLDLLYCDNTDSDLFLDITTQRYFLLISGRWYAGTAVGERLDWEHVPNDELPEPFTDIPADSVNGHVLAHVAGTARAREEALDNVIPQTSAVRRDDASLEVAYDGAPEFEPVEDTPEVRYAVNTAASVFLVGAAYFACDNAVWYRSSSPTGPWQVATEIPSALYSIPPSNPHHNVTYVHVYDVTPTVVYVGYTPGYVGSYWYRGCVVWGTGWAYHPWYGPHYYPRPWTWGLHVRYNPWYGWTFGVSWSNGPFRVSVGWGGGRYGPRYGGWYGHGGYRPGYRPYPPGPGWSKPRPPYGRPSSAGRPPSQLPADPGAGRPAASLYDRPSVSDRKAPEAATRDRPRPSTADGPNNVFTDRDGNVYRRNDNGSWDGRQGGQWKPAEGLDRPGAARPSAPSPGQRPSPGARPGTAPGPTTRPSTPPSTIRPPGGGATRPQLESDHRARQRGSQRMQQAPRAAPRGGGGRRR